MDWPNDITYSLGPFVDLQSRSFRSLSLRPNCLTSAHNRHQREGDVVTASLYRNLAVADDDNKPGKRRSSHIDCSNTWSGLPTQSVVTAITLIYTVRLLRWRWPVLSFGDIALPGMPLNKYCLSTHVPRPNVAWLSWGGESTREQCCNVRITSGLA